MTFKLERVQAMPGVLEPGVLYVSDEYETAAHLCACGCGQKIRTPLGPTEWSVEDDRRGPSLWPSVGSWQRACRSHYVIENGKVHWSTQWTEKQVAAGRRREEARRERYYRDMYRARGFQRGWNWIKGLFGR